MKRDTLVQLLMAALLAALVCGASYLTTSL